MRGSYKLARIARAKGKKDVEQKCGQRRDRRGKKAHCQSAVLGAMPVWEEACELCILCFPDRAKDRWLGNKTENKVDGVLHHQARGRQRGQSRSVCVMLAVLGCWQGCRGSGGGGGACQLRGPSQRGGSFDRGHRQREQKEARSWNWKGLTPHW